MKSWRHDKCADRTAFWPSGIGDAGVALLLAFDRNDRPTARLLEILT